jgi:bifunctional DNase/RNase
MEVVGVRVEMPSNSPIVLLKEAQGDRYLPIWIGAVEATAIAFAQQGMVSLRPLTHDLFKDVLEVLNVQLRTVNITALRDGIFYADLVFSNGAEVSARPSDSIALALRTGAAIFATDEILDEVGVPIPDEQEDEVEKFREFLDQISPEDFGKSALFARPARSPAGPPNLPGFCAQCRDAPSVIVDAPARQAYRANCRG